MGKIVFQKTANNKTEDIILPVADGIYFLKIEIEHGFIREKIVVAK